MNNDNECPDCEKGKMKEADLHGELVMQCTSCRFWIDIDIWKDSIETNKL